MKIPVTHLSDILVSYSADLLDVCCALGDVFERVTEQLEFIFLVFGCLDFDTGLHDDSADDFLTNEVSARSQQSCIAPKFTCSQPPLENAPDLNFKESGLRVLLKVDVDREMGVDVSHLVFETLSNTDDEVVD